MLKENCNTKTNWTIISIWIGADVNRLIQAQQSMLPGYFTLKFDYSDSASFFRHVVEQLMLAIVALLTGKKN